jgi:hypothetical protein
VVDVQVLQVYLNAMKLSELVTVTVDMDDKNTQKKRTPRYVKTGEGPG